MTQMPTTPPSPCPKPNNEKNTKRQYAMLLPVIS
jgi:hypothetical protein